MLIGSLVGSAGAVLAFMAGMYLGEQRTLQHFRHASRVQEEMRGPVMPASFETRRMEPEARREHR